MGIQVLLSTYNGEKYLRTQLESILKQSLRDLTILVRDDGSNDHTLEILKEYAAKDSRLSWYQGENLGVVKSFFDLVGHADFSKQYFAFADQDDQWLEHKLEKAVDKLEQYSQEVPALYCSDKIIADEELQPLDTQITREVKKTSFGNAIVQGICTGCTAVWNRSLMRLFADHLPIHAERVIMHDWWLYLVASCMGEVYYDPCAYIYYRQHHNNKWGAMISRKQLIKYRVGQLFEPRGEIYGQVREFLAAFGDEVPEKKRKLAEKLIGAEKSIPGRLKVICDEEIFRQKRSDNFVLKLIVLAGKL